MRAFYILVLSIVFCGFAFPAPQGGRLPLSEYLEIMQWQVLAPTGQIPEKEYVAIFAEPPTPERIAELAAAGIELVLHYETLGLLRGSITSFAAFAPESEAFPWVTALLPSVPTLTSATAKAPPNFYAVDPSHVFKETGVYDLHDRGFTGKGVKVGVLDVGFTGALGKKLPGRVHYLRVEVDEQRRGRLVQGFKQDVHGEACAEAIAAIAPEAEFYLISAPGLLETLYAYALIERGMLKLDILSDSTFYPIPLDHMDGKGELAKAAALVASKTPYFFAVGNMARCSATDRSMFRAVYSDRDAVIGHDFDPQSPSDADRNTLTIEVKPWEGPNPKLLVVLEWDGWPWQVKKDAQAPWTQEEIIGVQDVDLAIYYRSPTGRISRVAISDINQFARGGVPPVEYIYRELTTPGTYLIQVANVSGHHQISGVYTRPVEFHVCVYLMGGEFDLEHCTPDGSLINVAAAEHVVSVGAVGWTGKAWCVMPFSSQGPTDDGRLKPEFVAPTGYQSRVLDRPFGGTSAAAPVAAGIAALLRQADPTLSPKELVNLLLRGATTLCGQECNGVCLPKVRYNYLVGWGLVNAAESYRLIR
ncbi:MAG: S8 family serine peptidase [Candidatus Bipolaricaulota bacterium]|nr:S8 family serine peptidase [Candidatus Bipolaricaulota bacterium]MDW8127164.1 S8 family serine peptidase [Candidatus Bipolaricaulota bacterium]